MAPCRHKRKPGHKPVADCIECWFRWMEGNPEAVITAKDLRRILVHALGFPTLKNIAWDAYRDTLERRVEQELQRRPK